MVNLITKTRNYVQKVESLGTPRILMPSGKETGWVDHSGMPRREVQTAPQECRQNDVDDIERSTPSST